MKRDPAHPRLRRLAAGFASLSILLGILSLPWRGDRPAGPPVLVAAAAGSGPLLAGAAAVPLPAGEAPLIGGFPRLRWRAEGVRDPVLARALVLEEPGCRVALLSADVLLVPEALRDAVLERLRPDRFDVVVVAASHTHAGPGGYWDSFLGGRLATGPYDPATFAALAEALAGAVRAADAARGPAELAVARGRAPELVRNRTGAEADGRALVLRLARPGGEPVGELVVFAAHPTLLGSRNRALSGDWPGALSRAGRGVRLVLQGAIGDQSARVPAPAEAPVEAFAAALDARLTALPAVPVPAPGLAAAEVELALPPVEPGAVPRLLRPAAATLLGGAFPARARVAAVRLGPALLVATPAEPVAAVGEEWRAAAGDGAEVASLAGGYAGYADTAARFRAGAGEARRSYYGPELSERLRAGVAAAAAAAR